MEEEELLEPTELSRDVRKEPTEKGREANFFDMLSGPSLAPSVVDILKGKG